MVNSQACKRLGERGRRFIANSPGGAAVNSQTCKRLEECGDPRRAFTAAPPGLDFARRVVPSQAFARLAIHRRPSGANATP
jgi:hypothetical protein